MSDLLRLATRKLSDEGTWFTPVDLEGTPLDCQFKVLGPDSRKYAEIASRRRNKLIRSLAEAKDVSKASHAEDDVTIADELFELVVDWQNVEWNGEKVPYSLTEVKRILNEVPFIANQLDRWIGDRRNFIEPGSKS